MLNEDDSVPDLPQDEGVQPPMRTISPVGEPVFLGSDRLSFIQVAGLHSVFVRSYNSLSVMINETFEISELTSDGDTDDISPDGCWRVRQLEVNTVSKNLEILEQGGATSSSIRIQPASEGIGEKAHYTWRGCCFSHDSKYLMSIVRSRDYEAKSMRVELRKNEKGWTLVDQIDIPDPKPGQCDCTLDRSPVEGLAILKLEGNWSSHIWWVSLNDGRLSIRSAFTSDGAYPVSMGPVFSPDGSKYLLGNGNFDLNIGLFEFSSGELVGAVEWPGKRPGRVLRCLESAIFIDSELVIIRTREGRMFQLDTEKLKFISELQLQDRPAELSSSESFKGCTDLVDWVWFNDNLLTFHKVPNGTELLICSRDKLIGTNSASTKVDKLNR